MSNTQSPFKRVFITGALVGALSLTAFAAASAQEATAVPEAPAETIAQAEPGFLGVSLTDAGAAGGARVVAVVAGSAAEAAGILADDVIVAINGSAVTTAAEAAATVSGLLAGDEVALTLDRAGESLDVTATLAAQPETSSAGAGNRPNRDGRPFFQFRAGESLTYNDSDQSWTAGELAAESPLYAAGLRAGDVVTAIDGSQYDPLALLGYLASLGQDAELTLDVTRDGATVEVTAPALDFLAGGMAGFGMTAGRAGQMPGALHGFMMDRLAGQSQNGYLGLSFITLDEAAAAEQNAGLTDGALVMEVVADSPAATAGLLAGDIITAVNGEPVDAEHTLHDRLVAYEPDDVLTLTVARAGADEQVAVTLGQQPAPQGMRGLLEGMMPGGRNSRGQRGHGSQGPHSGMFPFMIPGDQGAPLSTPAPSGANA